MTNELAKQFFNTFRIEPKKGCTAYDKFTEEEADVICNDKCAECPYLDDVYPQITDRILLKSIVIMTRYTDIIAGFTNVQELKRFVLEKLMYSLTQPECDIVIQQVLTLFEEVANNDR